MKFKSGLTAIVVGVNWMMNLSGRLLQRQLTDGMKSKSKLIHSDFYHVRANAKQEVQLPQLGPP